LSDLKLEKMLLSNNYGQIIVKEYGHYTINSDFYDRSFITSDESIFDFSEFVKFSDDEKIIVYENMIYDLVKNNKKLCYASGKTLQGPKIFKHICDGNLTYYGRSNEFKFNILVQWRSRRNLVGIDKIRELIGTIANQPSDVFTFLVLNVGFTDNAVAEVRNSRYRFILCSENDLIFLMNIMEDEFMKFEENFKRGIDLRENIRSIKLERVESFAIKESEIIVKGNGKIKISYQNRYNPY
ncbi:14899_t:CDS:2, partial [Dentiscutata erythropus]